MVTSPGSENLIFYDFCTKNLIFGPKLGAPTGDLDLAGHGRPSGQPLGWPKLTERDISSDFSELISRPGWIFPGGTRYKLSKNQIQNLPNWYKFELISQIELISM